MPLLNLIVKMDSDSRYEIEIIGVDVIGILDMNIPPFVNSGTAMPCKESIAQREKIRGDKHGSKFNRN